MKTLSLFHCTAAVLLATTAWACAGQPVAGKEVSLQSPYDRGSMEFQVAAGSYFSLNNGGPKRPTLNDADLNLRLGWMLNDAAGPGLLRGNFEVLGDVYGGLVWDGPGTGLAGLNLLLRYNFVQPDSRCVPYFQIGAGALYNDIYRETPQRLIGQSFEFDLQAGLGFRWMLTPRCSVNLEGNFRHISNADQADRNLGLNSVGGLVGFSYFF